MPSGTIVCIGRNSTDHYYRCKNKFLLGEKILLEPIGSFFGGMIPNTASLLAALGVESILFDTLGNDQKSADLILGLQSIGVDTRHIHIDQNYATLENSIILHDTDKNPQSTILILDNTRVPYRISMEEHECMASSQYVYTTTKDLGCLENFDAADFFEKHSSRLVLDVEDIELSVSEQDMRYLMQADILIFNRSGYDRVTKEYEAGFFDELLASKPDKLIIHTQGSSGCTMYYHSTITKIDGIEVNTVDTTGAGDTFNAVLLARLLQDCSPDEAVRSANKAAALSTTVIGPRGYLSCMLQDATSSVHNQ